MAFSGVKRSGGNFGGRITFDSTIVNFESALNSTSGVFTAPSSGTYYFSLSALTGTSRGKTTITVSKKGAKAFEINEKNDRGTLHSLSYSWVEQLNAGDTIVLDVTSHKLYVGGTYSVFFNGFSLVISL